MGYYSNEEDGRVVWPIGDDIRYTDAVETVFAFKNSNIGISPYGEDGNDFDGNLNVILFSDNETFFRENLINLLKEEAESHGIYDLNEEVNVDDWPMKYLNVDQAEKLNKAIRLLVRLLRAYDEWDRVDNKMKWDELIINPLPKVRNVNE